MVEEKDFLANPKHQYGVPQCVEHDCSANNKKMTVIMSIQVCVISWMNLDYKENGANPNIMYTNEGNKIVVPITKGIEIIKSFQVYPISRIDINYKQYSGKKNFSCKSKTSISCIQMKRT